MIEMWKKGVLTLMQIAGAGAVLAILYLPVLAVNDLSSEHLRVPVRIASHLLWLFYGPILHHVLTRKWITITWSLK